jgi:hypothetical protein
LPPRYLKHDDIDPGKWDACLDKAKNGLIYGYSFHLDHMARHWDGLVLGDYEAVMPLPWNKKYGIHYLYQPAFTATGGVFGNDLDEPLIGQFIQAVPKKFRLIEINLNAGNIFSIPSGFSVLRNNYVLPLNNTYEALYDKYRDNIKRNIKKAKDAGCVVQTKIPVEDIIKLAAARLPGKVNTSDRDFQQFQSLYQVLQERQQAITYGIFSAAGELIASCAYFFSNGRAYYILVKRWALPIT